MPIYLKNSQRSIRLSQKRIKKDLNRALHLLGFQTAEVSVFFVGDRRMETLNHRYRGVNRSTDVLSFPMHEAGRLPAAAVLGDIVVSVPRAMVQARRYGVPFYDELRRLLFHGLLHLLGYDHEVSGYQKRKMERKERELFDAFKTMG